MATETPVIGIVGGSGLYRMDGLAEVREIRVETPFGAPSDAFVTGVLDGLRLVFLPRHGRGHRVSPTEINYRANVHGLKKLGVTRVVSVSSVGSMREDVHPGDIVVVDQFIDWTRHRPATFFSDGIVAHANFADPVCAPLSAALLDAARRRGARVHPSGTYICMEGPQFSTRAESRVYRQWGVDVIGMTNAPEAKLCREAEICYATLALVTDYDCWKTDEASVQIEEVLAVMGRNVALARDILRLALPALREPRSCACRDALKNAIVTDPKAIAPETRERLEVIAGRHLPR